MMKQLRKTHKDKSDDPNALPKIINEMLRKQYETLD